MSTGSLSSLFRGRSVTIQSELASLRYRFSRLLRQDAPPEKFAELKREHQALLLRSVHSEHLPAVITDYFARFNLDVHVINAAMQYCTELADSIRYSEAADNRSDPYLRKRPRSLRSMPLHDERPRKETHYRNVDQTVCVAELPPTEARLLPTGRYGINLRSADDYRSDNQDESRIICKHIIGLLPKIQCNSNTYRLAIKMASRFGSADMCQMLVDQAMGRGLSLTTLSWCSLIAAYGREKRLHEASRVFSMLQQQKVTHVQPYKAIMTAFGKFGETDVVWRLYERMKSENIKPTALIYETVLHFMTVGNRIKELLQVLEDMEAAGEHPLGPIVVDVVQRLGISHVDYSIRLWQRMNDPTMNREWHLVAIQLACVYARARRIRQADDVLQALKRHGKFEFNALDKCALVGAFSASGEYDRAKALLMKWCKDLGDVPFNQRNAVNQAVSDLLENSRSRDDIDDVMTISLDSRFSLMARTINKALRMYTRWHATSTDMDVFERRLLQSALWPADLYPALILACVEANDMPRCLRLVTNEIKSLSLNDSGACLVRRVKHRLLSCAQNSSNDVIRADLHAELLFGMGIDMYPGNFVAFAKSCIKLRRWDYFDRLVEAMARSNLRLPESLMRQAESFINDDRPTASTQPGLTPQIHVP